MTILEKIIIASMVAVASVWASVAKAHDTKILISWRMVDPDARPDSFNTRISIDGVMQPAANIIVPRGDDGLYRWTFPYVFFDVEVSFEVNAQYTSQPNLRPGDVRVSEYTRPPLRFIEPNHGPHPHPRKPPQIISFEAQSGGGSLQGVTFKKADSGLLEIQASTDLVNWSAIGQTRLDNEVGFLFLTRSRLYFHIAFIGLSLSLSHEMKIDLTRHKTLMSETASREELMLGGAVVFFMCLAGPVIYYLCIT